MFGHKTGQINTDPEKIDEILNRGTEDVFIREHLKKLLLAGTQLRVKLGIDPTSPDIHLGRAIPLRKLKAFQDLGHTAVFIIGDFTAKIADPSDKLEKRPMLSDEDIKKNLAGYLDQVGKILDLSKTEIHYNSEWLRKMDVIEIGKLLECFTVQQMSKRRNFQERLEHGQDIFVVEFMYPALQGYDSLKVSSDVEIGGFDQLFNLKAGRIVQKRYGEKEQDIMVLSMLPGTDGRKMSSSWGNIISLLDTKEDMFGKVMALRDDLIIQYFTLCTNVSLKDISNFEKELKSGVNPKDIKKILARQIVKMYHGDDGAMKAEENFEKTFSKGGIPDDVTEVNVARGAILAEVLLSEKLIESKNEWRRLVDDGAVTEMESGGKVTEYNTSATPGTYKIGKKRFIKIKES